MFLLTINDGTGPISFEPEQSTFRITETLNGRNVCTFNLTDETGSWRPSTDDEVIATLDGVVIFRGFVSQPTAAGFGGVSLQAATNSVTATSYDSVTERRYILSASLPAGSTVKDILTEIVVWLANWGVVLHPDQEDGQAMPEANYLIRRVDSILDELSDLTGWVWEIDYDRQLRMYHPGTTYPMPFTPAEGGPYIQGDVSSAATREDYANRILLLAGEGLKYIENERIPGDSQRRRYRLFAPTQNVVGNIYVDSYEAGGGYPVGVYGVDDMPWTFDAATNELVQRDDQPLIDTGHYIEVDYNGQFPAVVKKDDEGEQLLHGLYEDVVSVTDIFYPGTAEIMAQAILDQRIKEYKKVAFPTLTPGVHPGQYGTIFAPSRGLYGAAIFVTDVNVTDQDDGEFLYTVVAQTGDTYLGSWRDLYKAWGGSTTFSGSPPVGGSGGGSGGSDQPYVPAVIGEVPAGAIDGVNQIFSTAGEYGTVLAVYLNGIRQSSPAHYTETDARVFAMTDPPLPGDSLRVDYGDSMGLPSGGGGGSAGYTGQGTPGYLTKWLDVKHFGDSGTSEGPTYQATAVAGLEVLRLTSTAVEVKVPTIILGEPATLRAVGAQAQIWHDAPGAIGLRMEGISSALHIYDSTSVSNTNFERVSLGWFTNGFEIRGEVVGAGVPQNIGLRASDDASIYLAHTSIARWVMGPTGAFCSALDNVSDIGLSESEGRPRDIWLGRNLNLGQDGMPIYPYTSNLGAIYRKYLTLHCAELWVETLVAQYTMATIGGRILVGPTNILTRDVLVNDTVIYVKYNNLLLHTPGVEYGSKLWLESSGKFEMMVVTSTAYPVAETDGSFKYDVLRRQDGSPANDWYAGDAVMDTGKTGSGFIDLYSLRGIKSANEAGPTIVGNLRISGSVVDWRPRWAIGNLANLYGYGTTVFGVGMGDPAGDNITIDAGGPATDTQPAAASQGFRIRQGSTVKLQAVGGSLYLTGELVVGTAGVARSGATTFSAGTGWFFDYNGGTPRFRVGNPTGQRIAWDGSGNLTIVGSITVAGAPASGLAYADFSNVVAGYAASGAVRGAANDTAAVGGMAAATVQGGVNRANTGLDANGSLVTAVRPGYGVGAVLTGAGLYLGSDVLGFYNGGAWMTYMDNAGGFYLHGSGSNALYWDGNALNIYGAINATWGNFTGDVSVGTGGKIYSGMATYNTGVGWILEYNAGTPRFMCGDASSGNGISWDGVNLRLRSNRVTFTESGIMLYAAAARDLACSIYWDVGGGVSPTQGMGLFTSNAWNADRTITLENECATDYANQTMQTRLSAAISTARHATVMCLAQTKNPAQDRIEFDCSSGAYRFLGAMSGTGSDVIFNGLGYLCVNASDERLKRNIAPFTTGMTALRQIQPILFNGLESGPLTAGFSAQNVRSHVPEATPLNPDGYYGFQSRAMLAVVINALKEIDARLAALEG